MNDAVFEQLDTMYIPGSFPRPTSFYFSLDSIKKTVTLGSETCVIQDGKAVDEADCVCKMGAELFDRIWNEGYRPGIMDFMSGAIKSNNPGLLQDFLKAFGK